jgi:multicomponent Na+:H+ antiporter subunit A
MRWDRSLILDTSIAVVVPAALLLSLYLLFAGHNEPGGGFVGGLVAGAAFVLRYVASGEPELRHGFSLPPALLLGGGLVVAVVAGSLGWVLGVEFLDQIDIGVHLPVLGEIHTSTAVVFDVGVYLVVVGLVLAVLTTLGTENDE